MIIKYEFADRIADRVGHGQITGKLGVVALLYKLEIVLLLIAYYRYRKIKAQ